MLVSVNEEELSIAYIYNIETKTLTIRPELQALIPFNDVGSPNILFCKTKDRVANLAFVSDESIQVCRFVSGLDDSVSIELQPLIDLDEHLITFRNLLRRQWFPSEAVKRAYIRKY